MYEAYWQLERKPFENGWDPRAYYPGEGHQGAMLKLRYALESRHPGAVLAGACGVGKTMLVGCLRRQLSETLSPFVHVVFPQMPADQLLAWIADQLAGPAAGEGIPPILASVRRIERFLVENARASKHAVVAVDEAHLLRDGGALETLRLLLNIETGSADGLSLLLVGEPSLIPAVERTGGLEDRLTVRCVMRPLSPVETISYVSHRLKAAGAGRTIFEPEAVEAVHALTHGVPRRINRLCDLALLIGYAEERRTIQAAQIEGVADELVAVRPE
jgi:type II secretory pathway predicted ATPase ExeA